MRKPSLKHVNIVLFLLFVVGNVYNLYVIKQQPGVTAYCRLGMCYTANENFIGLDPDVIEFGKK